MSHQVAFGEPANHRLTIIESLPCFFSWRGGDSGIVFSKIILGHLNQCMRSRESQSSLAWDGACRLLHPFFKQDRAAGVSMWKSASGQCNVADKTLSVKSVKWGTLGLEALRACTDASRPSMVAFCEVMTAWSSRTVTQWKSMDFSMPLMDSCNPGWNNPSPLKAKIKTKKKGEYHDNLSVIYI